MRTRILVGLVIALLLGTLSATTGPSGKTKPTSQAVKPLTYSNVLSFFKQAGFKATEVQKRCTVFFEGEWKSSNIYDYCLIIVENSDEDVQVTFYLTDAHEMNWVTEFVDGPFFAQSETEQLFSLINAGRDVRGKNVGRFRVDFHRWEPRHAQIIVFSMTKTGG